ncbi:MULTISPECIES: hypothetical protein [unclassified Spirosoma]|uniref:hypothetical protein n=1 Tax=unclassified Spirosoma TaxID=2621999 RepID=UPI00095C934E|nr:MULTISPECIES: hypothetical protein [unclassified Spirosoma]MBN8823790.1 hypothetical protein [Spirosoma sp.]OJW79810.1 MAG: hypothetical protein BGO59_00750 [Spirosoma sp. 48-14]
MKKSTSTLQEELEDFRTKIKTMISQLYRANVTNQHGEVMAEATLTEEWEYEGQELNAITEQGLAYIIDNKIDEIFTWDDLETESLIEVVQILEDREFVES